MMQSSDASSVYRATSSAPQESANTSCRALPNQNANWVQPVEVTSAPFGAWPITSKPSDHRD